MEVFSTAAHIGPVCRAAGSPARPRSLEHMPAALAEIMRSATFAGVLTVRRTLVGWAPPPRGWSIGIFATCAGRTAPQAAGSVRVWPFPVGPGRGLRRVSAAHGDDARYRCVEVHVRRRNLICTSCNALPDRPVASRSGGMYRLGRDRRHERVARRGAV